ncbi:uncharacterized protein [Anoplolepis gracilipes]|uniref:uncharacterized protein n=1 Tax=Anoplolepis gracilipes TaxID=354296 RepID=UPI003BA20362
MAWGVNWMETRNTARLAVAEVVRQIETVGLKVVLQKTEAVFLHDGSHGAPPETQRPLERDTLVSVGSSFKYLGFQIDDTWGFREHFALLTFKVAKASAALDNLLPNLGGPGGVVRRLWCGTVQAMTLYEAPVWAERVMGDRVLRKMLRRIQRPMALRAARAYRTVSHRPRSWPACLSGSWWHVPTPKFIGVCASSERQLITSLSWPGSNSN